jgi:hypothetical protein
VDQQPCSSGARGGIVDRLSGASRPGLAPRPRGSGSRRRAAAGRDHADGGARAAAVWNILRSVPRCRRCGNSAGTCPRRPGVDPHRWRVRGDRPDHRGGRGSTRAVPGTHAADGRRQLHARGATGARGIRLRPQPGDGAVPRCRPAARLRRGLCRMYARCEVHFVAGGARREGALRHPRFGGE